MPSFPWSSLKAETLRSICKDLGATSGTKRKREDMIAFLEEIEARGLSSTSQGSEPAGKVVPTTQTPVSSNTLPEKNSDKMDTDDHPAFKFASSTSVQSTCSCADEWLSPRMRFILSTVAAVASDLILDTGEFAEEFGSVGGVWMTQHIPAEALPQGKKTVVPWTEGFSTIFRVIHEVFEAGRIPTEGPLSEALNKLPNSDRKLVGVCTRYTDIEYLLAGLVQQAKEEWGNEFQYTHCGGKDWRRLPKCAEHDLNWTLVEDMLTEA